MFAEGTHEFAGWYVNLEEPHRRDAASIYTSDRVLDLVVSPDGTLAWKEEDELDLAVAQGVFDQSQAAVIREDAVRAAALVGNHAPPFGDGWDQFVPDPRWPIPDDSALTD